MEKEINNRDSKIFMEEVIIDWYDGPIVALAKMSRTLKWYLASIVYFNPETNQRIFQLIEVEDSWAKQIKNDIQPTTYNDIKERIKNKFLKHVSDLYLIKGQYLDEPDLSIRKIPIENLKYYSSIEEVIRQDSSQSQKWLDFFD
ncbi:MAG: hypothetical protein M9904_18465 [Chitinophagaceae bacterium]|nr:hypothetical protein [Chitinophagaceae bacterium]